MSSNINEVAELKGITILHTIKEVLTAPKEIIPYLINTFESNKFLLPEDISPSDLFDKIHERLKNYFLKYTVHKEWPKIEQQIQEIRYCYLLLNTFRLISNIIHSEKVIMYLKILTYYCLFQDNLRSLNFVDKCFEIFSCYSKNKSFQILLWADKFIIKLMIMNKNPHHDIHQRKISFFKKLVTVTSCLIEIKVDLIASLIGLFCSLKCKCYNCNRYVYKLNKCIMEFSYTLNLINIIMEDKRMIKSMNRLIDFHNNLSPDNIRERKMLFKLMRINFQFYKNEQLLYESIDGNVNRRLFDISTRIINSYISTLHYNSTAFINSMDNLELSHSIYIIIQWWEKIDRGTFQAIDGKENVLQLFNSLKSIVVQLNSDRLKKHVDRKITLLTFIILYKGNFMIMGSELIAMASVFKNCYLLSFSMINCYSDFVLPYFYEYAKKYPTNLYTLDNFEDFVTYMLHQTKKLVKKIDKDKINNAYLLPLAIPQMMFSSALLHIIIKNNLNIATPICYIAEKIFNVIKQNQEFCYNPNYFPAFFIFYNKYIKYNWYNTRNYRRSYYLASDWCQLYIDNTKNYDIDNVEYAEKLLSIYDKFMANLYHDQAGHGNNYLNLFPPEFLYKIENSSAYRQLFSNNRIKILGILMNNKNI